MNFSRDNNGFAAQSHGLISIKRLGELPHNFVLRHLRIQFPAELEHGFQVCGEGSVFFVDQATKFFSSSHGDLRDVNEPLYELL